MRRSRSGGYDKGDYPAIRSRGFAELLRKGTPFMASELIKRFMRSLQQFKQTGDEESLIALFSDDTELHNMSKIEPQHGREGARQCWRQYMSVFAHSRSRFTNVLETTGPRC